MQLPPGWVRLAVVFTGGPEAFDGRSFQRNSVGTTDSLHNDELVFPPGSQNRSELIPQIDTLFDAARMNPQCQPSGILVPQLCAAPRVGNSFSFRIPDLNPVEYVPSLPHRPGKMDIEFQAVGGNGSAAWKNLCDPGWSGRFRNRNGHLSDQCAIAGPAFDDVVDSAEERISGSQN